MPDLRPLASIWMHPERSSRGGRPPLSRQRIVRAAIDLADERGLDGLTTRAIARRLEVGPTSMYWHVPTTADLHELMFDAVLGEIPIPDHPSRDWRQDLRDIAVASLRVLARHPWVHFLGIQPGIGPATRRYGQYTVAVLAAAGLDRKAAVGATAVLNNYLSGFGLRRAAWERLRASAGLGQQWESRLDDYLVAVRAQDPALAADIAIRAELSSDANFEIGLDCVLDGIASRYVVAKRDQTRKRNTTQA